MAARYVTYAAMSSCIIINYDDDSVDSCRADGYFLIIVPEPLISYKGQSDGSESTRYGGKAFSFGF